LRIVLLLIVICGIAFAGTVLLLRIPHRPTHEPSQSTSQVSPANPTSPPVSSAEQDWAITGRATVIDGDTVEIGRQRIRLHGIDAPEGGQTCTDANGKPYICGSKAAFALADFIGETNVRCHPLDRDQYGRTVARCFARDTDLAAFLVRSGWALDWPRYSRGAYAFEQQDAKNAKRGMWIGKFIEPWNWRACIRNGGQRDRCSVPN
jgi:endonuclease YncB( thermonuclease family)